MKGERWPQFTLPVAFLAIPLVPTFLKWTTLLPRDLFQPRVTSAALTNNSHAPDKGNHSRPCVYQAILVLEGQGMWPPVAGSSVCLMPDRTRDRTAFLRDITATGNFDSLQQSSSQWRRYLSGRKATRTHTPELNGVSWLKRMVAGLSSWKPGSIPGRSMWNLWWTNSN